MKTQRLIFILAGLGILLFIFFAANQISNQPPYDMSRFTEGLIQIPEPTPEWLVALAPDPGSKIIEDEAVFGDGGDPFWPGWGAICIQVDSSKIDVIGTELHKQTSLELNGGVVRRLFPKYLDLLLHGNIPRKGFVSTSYAVNPDMLNMCWQMDLPPGKYYAKISTTDDVDDTNSYEWAFEIIDK